MKLAFILHTVKCSACNQFSDWGVIIENKRYCDNCGADYSGINHATLLKMKVQKEAGKKYQQNKSQQRRYF